MLAPMRAVAIVLSLASSATPGAAGAQRRASPRSAQSGLWYGFGIAPGWARAGCAICRGERDPGISGLAAVGGTSSRGLRLGGELDLWRDKGGDVTLTLAAVGAVAYWFPNPRRRFFLKGGAAYLSHRASDGTDVITSTGIGPIFGAGHELDFGRRWRLALFGHYAVGAALGGVKFNGGDAADRATVTLLQVGVMLARP